MELTRKQKILLVVLIGCAALLIVGLTVWISTSASDAPPPEPQPSESPNLASETPQASPTATPAPTPSPTPYRLPLVPEGEAQKSSPPAPEAEADGTAITVRADARTGVYTAGQKEFLAIGTQNGEAVAVLLVQVKPPIATVLALPCEVLAPVYTLGAGCKLLDVQTAPLGAATARADNLKEGCWNLIWAVKNVTGYQAPEYLCVDFACMESFFAFAPSIPTESGAITLDTFRAALNETGETRAKSMGELGIGAAQYLLKVSLWELPGFKSATRDAFSASLSVLSLFSLLRTLKSVTTFSLSVLPTTLRDGVWRYAGTDESIFS